MEKLLNYNIKIKCRKCLKDLHYSNFIIYSFIKNNYGKLNLNENEIKKLVTMMQNNNNSDCTCKECQLEEFIKPKERKKREIAPEPERRICNICGEEKDINEYYINKQVPNFRHYLQCKKCYTAKRKSNYTPVKEKYIFSPEQVEELKKDIEYMKRVKVREKWGINSNYHMRKISKKYDIKL